jgi:hypothetical protein
MKEEGFPWSEDAIGAAEKAAAEVFLICPLSFLISHP